MNDELFNSFSKILETFNNATIGYTESEIKNKNEFVDTFTEILSQTDYTADNYLENIKTLMTAIVSYDISLIDMYKYFNDKNMTLETLLDFINNYNVTRNLADLTTVKLMIIDYVDKTFQDILDTYFKYNLSENSNFYFKPILKFSYTSKKNILNTSFSIDKKFVNYANQFTYNIENLLFNIDEFKNLFNKYFDYENNNVTAKNKCLLIQNNVIYDASLINFILNRLEVSTDDPNFIENLFNRYMTLDNKQLFFNNVSEMLYKKYLEKLYTEKNYLLNAKELLDELNTDLLNSDIIINIDNFKFYIFLAYILNNSNIKNKITEFYTELNNIFNILFTYGQFMYLKLNENENGNFLLPEFFKN